MNARVHRRLSGQSLIELLVAIAIGMVVVTATMALIVPMLKINRDATQIQVAGSLARELLENVRVLAESDWNTVASLPVGSSTIYHLSTSTSPFALVTGAETVTVASTTYSRFFYLDGAARSAPAGGAIDESGLYPDPSTRRVMIGYSWGGGSPKYISAYITRFKNFAFVQTDWSGGPGENGVLLDPDNRFTSSTYISYSSSTGSLFVDIFTVPEGTAGKIDSFYRYAWNDLVGWIDFYKTVGAPGEVYVYTTRMEGYASSSAGEFALNCATQPSPVGNNCAIAGNWYVHNGGGGLPSGDLSGWAWNPTYGWVSFCGTDNVSLANSECPLTPVPYRVSIRPNGQGTSDFTGWAWNDAIGWISFNCVSHGSCSPDYKVRTTWVPSTATGTLTSVIFDTGFPDGVQLNSITWRGELPAGTRVGFQIATSSVANPPSWNFVGPGGDSAMFYEAFTENQSGNEFFYTLTSGQGLEYGLYGGVKYFRYRIKLESDSGRLLSPRVDDIYINYSP